MDNSTPPPRHTDLRLRLPAPATAPRQGYRPGKSDGVLIAWTVLCALIPLTALFNDPDTVVVAWIAGFFIWVGPAFLLTIIYLMARSGRRRCPVCGTHVQTGRTQCAGCGHNFALAARH